MSKRLLLPLLFCSALFALLIGPAASGQSVEVTARFETNRIAVGGTVILRVYAQVVPNLRTNADRIFSWYVDMINVDSSVATADYTGMVKATSDNDPSVSSFGTQDGHHRRGIHDTFLNRPGAGVDAPIELLAAPVVGTAPGIAQVKIQAGTGVSALSHDFIVAPKSGDDFFTGGGYAGASAQVEVVGDCNLFLSYQKVNAESMQLSFTPCPSMNHFIEFASDLGPTTTWRALPGWPHNSGSVTILNPPGIRFFRIRAEPQ